MAVLHPRKRRPEVGWNPAASRLDAPHAEPRPTAGKNRKHRRRSDQRAPRRTWPVDQPDHAARRQTEQAADRMRHRGHGHGDGGRQPASGEDGRQRRVAEAVGEIVVEPPEKRMVVARQIGEQGRRPADDQHREDDLGRPGLGPDLTHEQHEAEHENQHLGDDHAGDQVDGIDLESVPGEPIDMHEQRLAEVPHAGVAADIVEVGREDQVHPLGRRGRVDGDEPGDLRHAQPPERDHAGGKQQQERPGPVDDAVQTIEHRIEPADGRRGAPLHGVPSPSSAPRAAIWRSDDRSPAMPSG